ncbi:AAA family ATPase [Planctomicrobium sp.]|jgi:DNA repair exonuclease SbcCD ATPase subunit|nr:AAA family ATPase [Planctomicrobium sp.]MDA7503489.1 AAA family ATPase [bacterium]MDB4733417.1 AAA family ATPase [Planctomicrobium sp.]
MIKRIELKNFMSHEHTVIEPAAGLTVLIGPNNVGKSAIIAALQILCYNENSTYVMRHGTKECSVTVETDDDHTIQWRRKKSPSYMIDGQKFDRLARKGVPEELHQSLRLSKVEANSGDAFDIHFGSQKTPIFLLDQSGATAARFFASSSDAIKLVAMQKKHNDKVRDARQKRIRLDKESEQLNAELAALEPVVAIDKRVEVLEDDYQSIVQFNDQLASLQLVESSLTNSSNSVSVLTEENNALAPLSSPPVLFPLEPLELSISLIRDWQKQYQISDVQFRALETLESPPRLVETEPLLALLQGLVIQERIIKEGLEQESVFETLDSPPVLNDIVSLERIASNLSGATLALETTHEQIDTLVPLQEPPWLQALEDLELLISNLRSTDDLSQQLHAQQALLTELSPLEIESHDELTELTDVFEETDRKLKRMREEITYFEKMAILEPPHPIHEVEGLLLELQSASSRVDELNQDIDQTEAELAEVVELIRLAAEDESCPVCGGKMSPEKLLEQAGRVTK